VLATLGRNNEEIPIADSLDEAAAVVRANALERLGDMDGAVSVLRARMARSNAFGRQALEHFAKVYPSLQLCAGSLPQASTQHSAVAAKGAASRAGGGAGMILILVGVGSVVLTGVIMAVTMLPMAAAIPAAFMTGGNGPGGAMAGLAIGGTEILVCVVVGVSTLLPLGFVGALGYGLMKRSREAALLRQNGIAARGQIRSLSATGTSINDVPLMRIDVSDASPQGPRQATSEMLVPLHLQMQLVPGATVPIRVHPQDPTKIMIEME
jgi:hypothetical protein